MPAIADQVATIEHDLSVALANLDSIKSENAQLKTALDALQREHIALQGRHMEAVALFDETRKHAQEVATAALTMLKVSRPQALASGASEGTKALQAAKIEMVVGDVAAAIEPEKTDVRPELPIIDQAQQDTASEPLQGDSGDEQPAALLRSGDPIYEGGNLVGYETVPVADDVPNTVRLRAHMEPLPIFLKPRAVPDANVLG